VPPPPSRGGGKFFRVGNDLIHPIITAADGTLRSFNHVEPYRIITLKLTMELTVESTHFTSPVLGYRFFLYLNILKEEDFHKG
jgi:hypothetical protein